ncbi:MAG TPA: DUF4279 domain-containing protein [Candidatus Binatia bacterium]|nr:DUF4279 domain-containing protein [Candidatus Binatia bacterium]
MNETATKIAAMKGQKIVEIRPPKILMKVGGSIDESGAILAIYGRTLDPAKISRQLGVEPTRSFKRGHRIRSNSHPMQHGAWFLQVRGKTPDGPEVQLRKLLQQLPKSGKIWKELNSKYTIQIRFGLHMSGWNKGFGLTPDLLKQLAKMRVELQFDIYAYGEEKE